MRDTFAVVRTSVQRRKTAMNYDEKKCNSAAFALRRAGGRAQPFYRKPVAPVRNVIVMIPTDLHERPRRGALV